MENKTLVQEIGFVKSNVKNPKTINNRVAAKHCREERETREEIGFKRI